MRAGTDLACALKNEYLDLASAVRRGLLSERELDTALHRVLEARLRLGILKSGGPHPFAAIPYSMNHDAGHRALALRAAREAIVLLKNDGILPLRRAPKHIAVIGPGATSLISLEGNYNGTPVGATLPLDALRRAFPGSRISFAQGSLFADRTAIPVPRSLFAGPLTATFFKGTEFSGLPVATRVYRELDVNWNWVAPAQGVDPRDFSVRWSGFITPPAVGDYRFELQRRRCDPAGVVDRYTISLDGAAPLHVDAPCSARDAGDSPGVTLHVTSIGPVSLNIEYAHRSHDFAPAVSFAWRPPATALRAEALRLVRQSELVVAFVGLNAWLEGEEMPVDVPGFSGGDRTSIELPRPQRALLDELERLGKPVILVLQSGSAVPLGAERARANAIIEAWYGGERGGEAIADVIRGDYNPSGRLPITVYRSTQDLPPFADYSMHGRTYRYLASRPEYPFGFGLSFTHFAYSGLTVRPVQRGPSFGAIATLRVRNAGSSAGDEVVQLYVSPDDRPQLPSRSLRAFDRIHLRAGEERDLTFELAPRELAFADVNGSMRVAAGQYSIWVGGGQPGTGAEGEKATFQVQKDVMLDP